MFLIKMLFAFLIIYKCMNVKSTIDKESFDKSVKKHIDRMISSEYSDEIITNIYVSSIVAFILVILFVNYLITNVIIDCLGYLYCGMLIYDMLFGNLMTSYRIEDYIFNPKYSFIRFIISQTYLIISLIILSLS